MMTVATCAGSITCNGRSSTVAEKPRDAARYLDMLLYIKSHLITGADVEFRKGRLTMSPISGN